MISLRSKSLNLFRKCRCITALNPRSYVKSNKDEDLEDKKQLGDMSAKYKIFKEEESEVILDVYEERLKYAQLLEEQDEPDDIFKDINVERGISGVFDIEDLVDVLKRENAANIFVAELPPEIKYVNYICIVTGRSVRHMKALAQFVKKVYKRKRNPNDIIPKLEGLESKDWIAIDLGNIALHIFSVEARERYDLDTLWTVGPKYDKEFNKEDPIVNLLEKHSVYLEGLVPAR